MFWQIVRMLTAMHSSHNGAKLQKMARSNDPEEARVGRNTLRLMYSVGGIAILICLLFICWPLVLVIAVLGLFFRK